jgi:hypothetical protein
MTSDSKKRSRKSVPFSACVGTADLHSVRQRTVVKIKQNSFVLTIHPSRAHDRQDIRHERERALFASSDIHGLYCITGTNSYTAICRTILQRIYCCVFVFIRWDDVETVPFSILCRSMRGMGTFIVEVHLCPLYCEFQLKSHIHRGGEARTE